MRPGLGPAGPHTEVYPTGLPSPAPRRSAAFVLRRRNQKDVREGVLRQLSSVVEWLGRVRYTIGVVSYKAAAAWKALRDRGTAASRSHGSTMPAVRRLRVGGRIRLP